MPLSEAPSFNQISWVILAGGQATRMGGVDKGLIPLNGKFLIEHVIDTLYQQTLQRRQADQSLPLMISANRNLDQYAQFAAVISDEFDNFPGPLGGIHAALQYTARQTQNQWLAVVPCDCPQLPLDLAERLIASCEPDTEVAVAHDGQRFHPVVSLINTKVLAKLEGCLSQGNGKIVLFYQECNMVKVDFSDNPEAFINLNSMKELHQFNNENQGTR